MRKQYRILKTFCHRLIGEWFPSREKPIVLQMPITSRCNSRCVTCNIWKHHEQIDIDATALKNALKDSFFSEVRTVGLNGGEFSLVPNFIDILDALTVLPRIEGIYLISNGIAGHKIKEYTKTAKDFCSSRGIGITLCISLDGVGITHDKIRGIPGNFEKTIRLIEEISNDSQQYCDQLVVGHTISRFNVDKIFEIEEYLVPYNVQLDVHLAVPNKRIYTFHDAMRYDVLADEKSRLLAAEYFYSKFLASENLHEKARCFANYYYLKNKGNGRLSDCLYRYRDVTIDENLNISLCATAGEPLGSLKHNSATQIIKSSSTKKEVKRLLKDCNCCIHYSYYPLTIKGRILFAKELVKQNYSMAGYRALCNNKYSLPLIFARLKRLLLIVIKYDI